MRLFYFFCCLYLTTSLKGQDVHFSQFFNAPLSINPALVGAMDADQRLMANYRHQWFTVPVPYETIAFSYDQKLSFKEHWLGLGGQFLYDQAGDANLNWLQLGLFAAFHYQLNNEHSLSIGAQTRIGQRALEPGQLFFDDQFTDNFFDPQVPTTEKFSNTNSGFSSFSSGVNWFYCSSNSRSRIWTGLGIHHLNRPTISFLGEGNITTPILWNGYTQVVWQVSPLIDVVTDALYQQQNDYREVLVMGGARYHLQLDEAETIMVQLSTGYRLEDAIITYIGVQYGQWKVGFSYDINTSAFQLASNRNGGPEISLQYLIWHVKPPEEFKICPIF